MHARCIAPLATVATVRVTCASAPSCAAAVVAFSSGAPRPGCLSIESLVRAFLAFAALAGCLSAASPTGELGPATEEPKVAAVALVTRALGSRWIATASEGLFLDFDALLGRFGGWEAGSGSADCERLRAALRVSGIVAGVGHYLSSHACTPTVTDPRMHLVEDKWFPAGLPTVLARINIQVQSNCVISAQRRQKEARIAEHEWNAC